MLARGRPARHAHRREPVGLSGVAECRDVAAQPQRVGEPHLDPFPSRRSTPTARSAPSSGASSGVSWRRGDPVLATALCNANPATPYSYSYLSDDRRARTSPRTPSAAPGLSVFSIPPDGRQTWIRRPRSPTRPSRSRARCRVQHRTHPRACNPTAHCSPTKNRSPACAFAHLPHAPAHGEAAHRVVSGPTRGRARLETGAYSGC